MRKFKVKGNIREWNDGTIITEDDLKKYPEMGGVARLRDEMGVLEDYIEGPPADPEPPVIETTTTGDPAPNVKRAGRSGRS